MARIVQNFVKYKAFLTFGITESNFSNRKTRSTRLLTVFFIILFNKKLLQEGRETFCHTVKSEVGGVGAVDGALVTAKRHKLLTGDEVCVLIARHLRVLNGALDYVEAVKLHIVEDLLRAVHYDDGNVGMCGTNALEECLVSFGEVLV